MESVIISVIIPVCTFLFGGLITPIISQKINHYFAKTRDLEKECREEEKKQKERLSSDECDALRCIDHWTVRKISESTFRFGNNDHSGKIANGIHSLIQRGYFDSKINNEGQKCFTLNSEGIKMQKTVA